MIDDMLSNKKFDPVVTELFIGGRKPNIPILIKQLYFAVTKNSRLNSTHHSSMKIPNNKENLLVNLFRFQ